MDGCGSDVKTAADGGGGGTLLPGDCCRRRYVEPTLLCGDHSASGRFDAPKTAPPPAPGDDGSAWNVCMLAFLKLGAGV